MPTSSAAASEGTVSLRLPCREVNWTTTEDRTSDSGASASESPCGPVVRTNTSRDSSEVIASL